ncbi:GNAT family N-acetyltransferase [Leptospira kanakyensis]|nr:GNAT family N-acetyltransferase [Leptospira kanakyensis]
MFKIEELSINAWPALSTLIYDGWIIRMANGYSKRANSINPLYKFYHNFNEKLVFCETLFLKHSLPIIFKITSNQEHDEIDIELEKQLYEKIDLTSVQINNNIIHSENKFDNIIIESYFTNEWINNFIILSKIENKLTNTITRMLNLIQSEVIVVSKIINNKFIGCAFGVMEDGYVGIFDLVIDEKNRNNGFATEIINVISEKALDKGIKKSYLQVVTTNTPAMNLYKKLGFKEEYKYWYRIKSP